MSAPSAPRRRALGPLEALRGSWRILLRRPVAMISLGAALFTSFAAVCCGLGFAAAPWFMCELFAMQIGSEAGESPRRTRAWFAAGALQFCGVVVLSVLAFLTALALGPEALLGTAEQVPHAVEPRFASLWSTALAGALALLATVHFQYAPAILIERGGRLYGAVLASAELVHASGLLRTWLSSITAHALPIACLALGLSGQLAFAGTRAFTVFLLLVTVPLVALATALGQGMIVANYLALRGDVPLRRLRAPNPAWALHGLLLAALMLGSLLLTTTLLKPAPLASGALPAAAPIVLESAVTAEPRTLYLPDSALHLELRKQRIAVVASDGGGAGWLPLPRGDEGAQIERVRVARLFLPSAPRRSTLAPGTRGFSIELTRAGGPRLITLIDESGVRLDDSLRRRFALLFPGRAGLLLVLCWLGVVAWSACVLPRAARTARERGEVSMRQAIATALWLAPAALLSFALGLWVFVR